MVQESGRKPSVFFPSKVKCPSVTPRETHCTPSTLVLSVEVDERVLTEVPVSLRGKEGVLQRKILGLKDGVVRQKGFDKILVILCFRLRAQKKFFTTN